MTRKDDTLILATTLRTPATSALDVATFDANLTAIAQESAAISADPVFTDPASGAIVAVGPEIIVRLQPGLKTKPVHGLRRELGKWAAIAWNDRSVRVAVP